MCVCVHVCMICMHLVCQCVCVLHLVCVCLSKLCDVLSLSLSLYLFNNYIFSLPSLPGSAKLLGDMLCLVGAILYAAGNVCQEYLVKSHSIVEYLGLIGIVGSFVSGAQL